MLSAVLSSGSASDNAFPYSLRLSPELTLRWGLDYGSQVLLASVDYSPGGGRVWQTGAITGNN